MFRWVGTDAGPEGTARRLVVCGQFCVTGRAVAIAYMRGRGPRRTYLCRIEKSAAKAYEHCDPEVCRMNLDTNLDTRHPPVYMTFWRRAFGGDTMFDAIHNSRLR